MPYSEKAKRAHATRTREPLPPWQPFISLAVPSPPPRSTDQLQSARRPGQPSAVKAIFDRFERWSRLRAILQVPRVWQLHGPDHFTID
jgi:hypothetical protein